MQLQRYGGALSLPHRKAHLQWSCSFKCIKRHESLNLQHLKLAQVSCSATSNDDCAHNEPAPKAAGKQEPTSPTSQATQPSLFQRVIKLIDSQCIPFVLIVMMSLGSTVPSWGQAAADAGLTTGVTRAIFIISGLQIRRGEALAALKAWGCVVWGLASILFFTPLLGPLLLSLPLGPDMQPLLLGTAVFCCMPTTLSSGISMTTAAGGNTALAILLTLASNLLGVATLPALLPGLLGSSVGSALHPITLLVQLCQNVLLPTLLGAVVRGCVPGVAAAVDGNKKVVVWLSALCLGMVPWMQVSKAVGAGMSVPAANLLTAAILGAVAHIAFLIFNWVSVTALNLGGQSTLQRAQLRQALVLQTSQKTLPVAVAVLSEGALAAQLGPTGSGLAAISAVAAHLAQVLIDSLLVGRWTSYIKDARRQEEEQLHGKHEPPASGTLGLA